MCDGFFFCLKCGCSDVVWSEHGGRCLGCGGSYPVIDGMPIVVEDWLSLECEINHLKESLPGWYCREQVQHDVSPWRHHLRRRRLYVEGVIRNYLKERSLDRVDALLDLGCGDGNNLSLLSPYASSLLGSDYNLTRLLRAKAKQTKALLFLANILKYPIRSDYFDVIFFNHVLEHIAQDGRALAEVFRILKPGGLLILGLPNEGCWWWQLAYKLQPQIKRSTDHVNFYDEEKIRKKMAVGGFNVISVKHLGYGFPHWSLDEKMRKYKWVESCCEMLGRSFIPHQSTSLYVVASK